MVFYMSLNAPDEVVIGTGVAKKAPETDKLRAQLEKIRAAMHGSFADILRLVLGLHNDEWTLDERVALDYYQGLLMQKGRDSTAMQVMALLALRDRFAATPNLHTDCDWNRVEATLIENPASLNALIQMELAGHEPNVYKFDDDGFDIGTCSPESPLSGRNCVYDAEAAEYLRQNLPNEQCNGSAVEQAKAMGICLMTEEKYRQLQTKGRFDRNSWSWLSTPNEVRKPGFAFFGRRTDYVVSVGQNTAYTTIASRGWRGSLRVLWDKA